MVEIMPTISISELIYGPKYGSILGGFVYSAPRIGCTQEDLKRTAGIRTNIATQERLRTLLNLNLVKQGEAILVGDEVIFFEKKNGSRFTVPSNVQFELIKIHSFFSEDYFKKEAAKLEQLFIKDQKAGIVKSVYLICSPHQNG